MRLVDTIGKCEAVEFEQEWEAIDALAIWFPEGVEGKTIEELAGEFDSLRELCVYLGVKVED